MCMQTSRARTKIKTRTKSMDGTRRRMDMMMITLRSHGDILDRTNGTRVIQTTMIDLWSTTCFVARMVKMVLCIMCTMAVMSACLTTCMSLCIACVVVVVATATLATAILTTAALATVALMAAAPSVLTDSGKRSMMTSDVSLMRRTVVDRMVLLAMVKFVLMSWWPMWRTCMTTTKTVRCSSTWMPTEMDLLRLTNFVHL
mmetsp:Transcript_38548/g.63181  ORF Transcript_38548/g.63181 Transcript_38548/m.63181 type:complete len:201 (-) Transcript_38548:816-1418(-)